MGSALKGRVKQCYSHPSYFEAPVQQYNRCAALPLTPHREELGQSVVYLPHFCSMRPSGKSTKHNIACCFGAFPPRPPILTDPHPKSPTPLLSRQAQLAPGVTREPNSPAALEKMRDSAASSSFSCSSSSSNLESANAGGKRFA